MSWKYLHSASFHNLWSLCCPVSRVDCLFGGIVVSVRVVRVGAPRPAPACRVTPGAGPAPPIVSSSRPRPEPHRRRSSTPKAPQRAETDAAPHGPVIHLSGEPPNAAVAHGTHWTRRHLGPDYRAPPGGRCGHAHRSSEVVDAVRLSPAPPTTGAAACEGLPGLREPAGVRGARWDPSRAASSLTSAVPPQGLPGASGCPVVGGPASILRNASNVSRRGRVTVVSVGEGGGERRVPNGPGSSHVRAVRVA